MWFYYHGVPERCPDVNVQMSDATAACFIDTRSDAHHNREMAARYSSTFEIGGHELVAARQAVGNALQYPETENCVQRLIHIYCGERMESEDEDWNKTLHEFRSPIKHLVIDPVRRESGVNGGWKWNQWRRLRLSWFILLFLRCKLSLIVFHRSRIKPRISY